jgi:hypothetical protein
VISDYPKLFLDFRPKSPAYSLPSRPERGGVGHRH